MTTTVSFDNKKPFFSMVNKKVSSVRNVELGKQKVLLIIEWLLCHLWLIEMEFLWQWNLMHLFFCKHPTSPNIVLSWKGTWDFYQIIYCERCDKPQIHGIKCRERGLAWRREIGQKCNRIATSFSPWGNAFSNLWRIVSNQSLRESFVPLLFKTFLKGN